MSKPETSNKRIILFAIIVFIMAGAGIGWAAIPQNTIRNNAGLVMPTVNATTGYWVGTNQIIDNTRAAFFTDITDTGLVPGRITFAGIGGILTDDADLTFVGTTLTATDVISTSYTIGADTLDTNEWANLDGLDQSLAVADNVNFSSIEAEEYYLSSVNKTDIFKYPQQAASYLIWRDGSTYYAKNGTNGSIDYSGSNAATVINAAITSVNANDGGLIYFKSGVYSLTSSVILLPSVSLQGEGSGRTGTDIYTLFVPSFNGYAINATNGVSTYYASSLRDFRIECNAGAFPGSGGVYLKLVSFVYIENVRVWGPGEDSFFMDGACANIYLRDTYSQNPVRYPYHVDGGTHIDFDNAICDGGDRSVFINNGHWINIVNSHFEGCSGIGIYAITGNDLTISQTKVINAGTEGIRTGSAFVNVTVSITSVYGQPGSGIHSQSDRTKIIGNTVKQASGQIGIQMEGSDNSIINSNTVIGSGDGKGINVDGNCDYTAISLNILKGNTVKSMWSDGPYSLITNNIVDQPITGVFTTSTLYRNIGFVTENSGLSTLYNLTSSVTIAHGLAYTPTADEFSITFTSSLANVTQWWISGIGAANFDLNVGSAGVAKNTSTNITFGWSVNRQ